MDKQKIKDAIDSATEPSKMTKQEALAFLEDIADYIDMQAGPLREELEE